MPGISQGNDLRPEDYHEDPEFGYCAYRHGRQQKGCSEDFEERTEKAHKREGEKINTADSGKVKKFLNNPYINVSKVIEDATGLEPTSASSEGSKFASGERPITQNLQNTVNRILQDLTN